MKPQGPHGMLPHETFDEAAREHACASMRTYFTTELIPGNKELYQNRLVPEFVREHGRAPTSVEEVESAVGGTFYYRAGSLFGRATQELLWDTVGESVERQIDTLVQRAKVKNSDLGTLELNPTLEMPRYIEETDIHCMPGNFQTELGEDDVLAGALYDRGAYIFAAGSRGEYNHNLGVLIVELLKEKFPDFKPRRTLEIGCGVGASTLPIKDGYPDAEVHAVDIGAPMLRYAHGRAESLGKAIHFSQQDGSHLRYPDEHFDLVLSALVWHEQPHHVVVDNLKEAFRVLAPGGVFVIDGKLLAKGEATGGDPFQTFMRGWFSRNINEPYGKGVDFARDLASVGFKPENTFTETPEGDGYLKGHLPPHSYVVSRKL